MLIAGAFAVALSSFAAWAAPSIGWLYLVFVLSGLANVSYWTIGMAMTVRFWQAKASAQLHRAGQHADRPGHHSGAGFGRLDSGYFRISRRPLCFQRWADC